MRRQIARDRYDAVAMTLHWVMAPAILALIAIGLAMTHLMLGPARLFALYQLHKSIGITVLLAAALRLAWRLTHRPPEMPDEMPSMERRAAAGAHWLLYGALFALPLSGWALVSVSPLGIPTVLFGVVPWPHLTILSGIADRVEAEKKAALLHAWGAYLLTALVAVHVAAAVRHHVFRRDGTLLRMLPGRRVRLP